MCLPYNIPYPVNKNKSKTIYFAERMAIPPKKEKKVLFLIWGDDEVHPKSWTQPLRCIFYEERTQNKPSV